jgi:hypothetical protein
MDFTKVVYQKNLLKLGQASRTKPVPIRVKRNLTRDFWYLFFSSDNWYLCGNLTLLCPLCNQIRFPHKKKQCCQLHRCDMHCTVISLTPLWHEKMTLMKPWDLIFGRLWLPLKRISIKKSYRSKLSYTIAITFTLKI